MNQWVLSGMYAYEVKEVARELPQYLPNLLAHMRVGVIDNVRDLFTSFMKMHDIAHKVCRCEIRGDAFFCNFVNFSTPFTSPAPQAHVIDSEIEEYLELAFTFQKAWIRSEPLDGGTESVSFTPYMHKVLHHVPYMLRYCRSMRAFSCEPLERDVINLRGAALRISNFSNAEDLALVYDFALAEWAPISSFFPIRTHKA